MSPKPPDFSPDPAAVERAIARLPFLEREVLRLKARDGFTFSEIGAILGVSPQAAEARFARALFRLRAQLGRRPRQWWPW
jgi:DNA-directed RNA polymerase specialized sigma24 family protein